MTNVRPSRGLASGTRSGEPSTTVELETIAGDLIELASVVAPILERAWLLGLRTEASGAADPDGWPWIRFATATDRAAFLAIAGGRGPRRRIGPDGRTVAFPPDDQMELRRQLERQINREAPAWASPVQWRT
jgi:hypothetical protein